MLDIVEEESLKKGLKLNRKKARSNGHHSKKMSVHRLTPLSMEKKRTRAKGLPLKLEYLNIKQWRQEC